MTLLSHTEWTDLVDYFAGDLGAEREEALETHLLACDLCTMEGSRVAAITQGLRSLLPPFGTRDVVNELHRRGLRIDETTVVPGADQRAVLGPHLDVMILRLQGVNPLAVSATFTMRVMETGELIFQSSEVPIDEDGSVALLCSRHYAQMPPNLIASVITRDSGGAEARSEYVIRHVWLD